jgi:cytochrome c-type biogenesis protein CcmH/NrfG
VASAPADDKARGVSELRKIYEQGDLPRALSLCTSVAADDPNALTSVDFLLCYAKVLLESEGPSSKIKSLLGKAFTLEPENPQVIEYLEVVDAKGMLTKERNDLGERKLAEILRRSPANVHALFLLGAHLFWVSGDTNMSVRYLEKCVSLHPKFLRAWGCLGSIYEKLRNGGLAGRAYRQCITLETEPGMKTFFEKKIAALAA